MRVVDTNVLFSFAVENDRSRQARALANGADDWHTEQRALVEVTNVLVRYVRNQLMSDDEALQALQIIEASVAGHVRRVAHRDAYLTARALDISAYDARLIVLARELGVPLVTEDAKLRRAAPDLTQSLDQALDAA